MKYGLVSVREIRRRRMDGALLELTRYRGLAPRLELKRNMACPFP